MVAFNRKLVNTLFLFDFISLLSNPQVPCNNMAMNMEINTPRSWSTNSSTNTSTNSSRAILVYPNVSSTVYTEYIQALNNNST